MIMMMLVLQDGDVIQYTINVRKLEEDTEDNNIITLVKTFNLTLCKYFSYSAIKVHSLIDPLT